MISSHATKCLVVVCLSVQAVSGDFNRITRRKAKRKQQTDNGNNVVDKLITYSRPQLEALEKSNIMADFSETFTKKTLFLTLQLFVKGDHGAIHGLTTLYRTGNAFISFNPKTGVTRISAAVGLKRLVIAYTVHIRTVSSLKIFNKKSVQRVTVTVLSPEVNLVVERDTNNSIIVSKLKVTRSGRVNCSVGGLKMFVTLANEACKHVLSKNRKKMIRETERRLKQVLQSAVKHLKL